MSVSKSLRNFGISTANSSLAIWYCSIAVFVGLPVVPRVGEAADCAWSEIEAELLIAALSAAFVIAALFGHCDLTGATIGGLGLVASLAAIIGWWRRPLHDRD